MIMPNSVAHQFPGLPSFVSDVWHHSAFGFLATALGVQGLKAEQGVSR